MEIRLKGFKGFEELGEKFSYMYFGIYRLNLLRTYDEEIVKMGERFKYHGFTEDEANTFSDLLDDVNSYYFFDFFVLQDTNNASIDPELSENILKVLEEIKLEDDNPYLKFHNTWIKALKYAAEKNETIFLY